MVDVLATTNRWPSFTLKYAPQVVASKGRAGRTRSYFTQVDELRVELEAAQATVTKILPVGETAVPLGERWAGLSEKVSGITAPPEAGEDE